MKRIAMYDLEGYLLEVFEVEFYKDLEVKLKLPQGTISSLINNRAHQCNNRQFKELKAERVALKKIGAVYELVNGSSEYKIIVKMYNGLSISAYKSLKEAAYKNNLDRSALTLCLNGQTKSCGGFTWKYA